MNKLNASERGKGWPRGPEAIEERLEHWWQTFKAIRDY